MRAMILAAGLGTRLRPLTDDLPKPLLPLAGQPLLVWNLLLLRLYGVREVIINLHYLGDLIQAAIGDGARFGVRVSYSHEPALLGTGGGIKQVEPFFEGAPFLVLNGDTVVDVDLGALMEFHRNRNGLVTMVLRADPDAERWGPVALGPRQQVLRINGNGRAGPAEAIRMFAGVHVVHPRALRTLPSGKPSSIIEGYVAEILAGEAVYGYEMTGYWSDVGTPERYRAVQEDVRVGRLSFTSRAGLLSERG